MRNLHVGDWFRATLKSNAYEKCESIDRPIQVCKHEHFDMYLGTLYTVVAAIDVGDFVPPIGHIFTRPGFRIADAHQLIYLYLFLLSRMCR